MREISTVKYDSRLYSDVNMLMNYNLIDPVNLDVNLTYMWGHESNRFPLLSLTAGNNAIATKKSLNGGDTQYKFPVKGRRRVWVQVIRVVSGQMSDGSYLPNIEVELSDNWLIHQHSVVLPYSGMQYRVQAEGKPTGVGSYIYRLASLSGNPNAQPDARDFLNGTYWGMGAPSIPGSKSDGNRSNTETFAYVTNQYGYYRFSKHIAGNIGSKVVNVQVDLSDGSRTNLWMPYEMREWELLRRDMLEEDLWFSEYNRDINGVIHNIDEETGEVIPRGAGVRDILNGIGNVESYSRLSTQLLDSILSRIFDNRFDETTDEVVIYGGIGFFREFNDAMFRDARFKNYFTALGKEEVISGSDGFLSYGKYFNQYRYINGKIITVKQTDIFDKGIRAEADRRNGRMHRGLPYTSYTGVFMDHSLKAGGERNIQFVVEEGREYQVGIYKGMAKLPGSWSVMDDRAIADRKDIATYEVIGSQGINFKNPTTSFWCELGI